MRRHLSVSLLGVVLACAAVVTAQQPAGQQQSGQQPAGQPQSGQQPAGQPAAQDGFVVPQRGVTFRTETNFVEVHAIVTDESGAFVNDLTQDDFEVYEDGKLQKPAAFSLIELPIERPFVPANGSEPVEPDVRATTRTFDGRIYVLLLDDLHTHFPRSAQVRDVARQFIDRYLGVNDLAAVVYTSGRQDAGQELTNNRRLLFAAIDRFQGQKLPSAGLEKLALHLRQNAQELTEDEDYTIRTNERLQRAEQVPDLFDAERGYNARRALDAIENVSKWLSDVQGRRKALLFFSEGIDYDIYAPFNRGSASAIVSETQEAISNAQRANVNVYGIDPRGLSNFGELVDVQGKSDYPQLEFGTFRGFLHELLLSQESLIAMSSETGGLPIVRTGDVAGGLGRIVLDNSRYYLLGYYSDASKWNRKFLKIDVKVKRPGFRVRARRGFMPPDPKAEAKAREAEVKAGTTPALKAALSKPVPVGELPVRAFAAPFKGQGSNSSVLVAIEVDGRGLKFQEREGRFVESLELSIVAADQRAKVQGGDRQTFNMNLQPQTRENVSRTGVRLVSRLDLPPGRYQLHIGVHESTGGGVATVPYDLEVPDYSKAPLALSGLLVSSSEAGQLVTAYPDDAVKNLFPVAPIVRRKFSPSETLAAVAEVYVNGRNGNQPPNAITFVTTVQDAQSGRDVFKTEDRQTPDPSDRAIGFRTDVPLNDLAPGMYVLRVDAASNGVAVGRREVLFEVF